MKVFPIVPHGLCTGVNRAVASALKLKGAYCLHPLVHNEIVIGELKELGYRFVESVEDIPEGETVVFSAHGVTPDVRRRAEARKLKVVDLTCPYVAKAHRTAREAAARGDEVVVLGDRKHAEVVGLLGELSPRSSADRSSRPLSVVCQTTMNLEESKREVAKLSKGRTVGNVSWPCPATQERQDAVKRFVREQAKAAERPGRVAVLVLGSGTSANTLRLKAIAEDCGARAYLAGTVDEVRALKDELGAYEAVGVTSGASTPERIFEEMVRILNNVPQHLAVIMDGNGRWAQARGRKRGEGHVAGAKTLSKVVRWCGERNIRYLTVFAFSTENWRRSADEVGGLMKLFATVIRTNEASFVKNRVRFRVIGRRGDLPVSLQKAIARLEKKTEAFERQLIVCVSYGGRAEIADAVNRAIAKGEPVTEETFRNYLYAPDVPDPDLVIRTSGEKRISNFLLWESAYAEYVFMPTLWPDFTEADLDAALAEYAVRNRRRGGVS